MNATTGSALPRRRRVETSASDAELILAARAGDRPAFEALVRRYERLLYFTCFRYVRDHDVAADLSQRAFIRVMESMQDLRESQNFRSWLVTIGLNLARNHLREHAKFVEAAQAERGVEPEVHARLESAEQSRALRQAVGGLPNKQRKVLELRLYQELPFQAIARALDTTENAAKVSFHTAVKKLRGLLGPSASA